MLIAQLANLWRDSLNQELTFKHIKRRLGWVTPQVRKHQQRVNIYAVMFRKAGVELWRLSLYCLNVAMAIVSSRSYMFSIPQSIKQAFPLTLPPCLLLSLHSSHCLPLYPLLPSVLLLFSLLSIQHLLKTKFPSPRGHLWQKVIQTYSPLSRFLFPLLFMY